MTHLEDDAATLAKINPTTPIEWAAWYVDLAELWERRARSSPHGDSWGSAVSAWLSAAGKFESLHAMNRAAECEASAHRCSKLAEREFDPITALEKIQKRLERKQREAPKPADAE
jgi:hypothetical protein